MNYFYLFMHSIIARRIRGKMVRLNKMKLNKNNPFGCEFNSQCISK